MSSPAIPAAITPPAQRGIELVAELAEINRRRDAATKELIALMQARLLQDLAPGTVVNIRTPGQAFQAKVMRGTHHQNTPLFKLVGKPGILNNVGDAIHTCPVLARWQVTAVALRASDQKPYSGEVQLVGQILPFNSLDPRPDLEQLAGWLAGESVLAKADVVTTDGDEEDPAP